MSIEKILFYKKGIKEQMLFKRFAFSVDTMDKIYQNNLNCIDAFEIDLELDVGVEECKDMVANINIWRKSTLKYKNALNESVGLDLAKIIEQPKKFQVQAALHPNYLNLRTNNDMKQLGLLYLHWKKNLKVLWAFMNMPSEQVTEDFLVSVEQSFENLYKICLNAERVMVVLKKKILIYESSIERYLTSEGV